MFSPAVYGPIFTAIAVIWLDSIWIIVALQLPSPFIADKTCIRSRQADTVQLTSGEIIPKNVAINNRYYSSIEDSLWNVLLMTWNCY